MNSSAISLFFAVGCLPLAAAQAISIHVYDSAHVPSATLRAAMQESARLFQAAGIRLVWQSNAPLPEDLILDMSPATAFRGASRPYLSLSILPRIPDNDHPRALGFALPFAHTGPQAIVFYNRIEMLAQSVCAPPYLVLGHTIAHELGHDLLRSKEHSAGGLMQASWNRASWELIKQGLLSFSPLNRKIMRQAVFEMDDKRSRPEPSVFQSAGSPEAIPPDQK
jgi:hypothetical protein